MGRNKTCTECGCDFYSLSGYVICDRCREIIMLGYSTKEKSGYIPRGSTFAKANKQLIEDCIAAKKAGKSYGQYKADRYSERNLNVIRAKAARRNRNGIQ